MPKATLHPCCLPAGDPRLVKRALGLDQSWATCVCGKKGPSRGTKTRSTSTSTWHEQAKRPGRVDYTGGRCVSIPRRCKAVLMVFHRGVLIKLFVFTLSLGMVPVVSYFASLKYVWSGMKYELRSKHSGSHLYPRKLYIRSNYICGSCEYSPCSVHFIFCDGRPAGQNNHSTNSARNKERTMIYCYSYNSDGCLLFINRVHVHMFTFSRNH